MYSFCAYDLRVASHWPIPGAMPAIPGEGTAPDRANLQIVSTLHTDADAPLHFGIREAGMFSGYADGRLAVVPLSGVSHEAFISALLATALPAMLWLRGDVVLHATAVQPPGARHAIAIAGASLSGKSTVLEQCLAQGWSVIGDDTLCLRVEHEEVAVSGLPACYMQRAPGVLNAIDRHRINIPDTQQMARASLGAVVVLVERVAPGRGSLARLRGEQAFMALFNNCHRLWVPRRLGSEPLLLVRIGEVLKRVPVFAWYREQGRAEISDAEWQYIVAAIDY